MAAASCADGSKGPRLYDWALIGTRARTAPAGPPVAHPGEKGELELAFYRCWSPRPVTLPELAAVAGARWGIEDCFGEAKNEAGLDHYQVRKYRAWYRHSPCPCSRTRSSPSPPGPRPHTPEPFPPAGTSKRPPEKGDLTPAEKLSRRQGHTPAALHNR